jgi:hypothetical protein
MGDDGSAVIIIFGEVYEEAVVAVRVNYEGGSVNAVVSGGGYHATLPPDAVGIVAQAYDAAGALLFESAPPPPPE